MTYGREKTDIEDIDVGTDDIGTETVVLDALEDEELAKDIQEVLDGLRSGEDHLTSEVRFD